MSSIRFPSLCLWVLWWPSRDVRMCHGRRWRVCARVSVRFFVCVRVRVLVSLGKVHSRAAQRSLSGEQVGEGHSQPLSLIMWASSMMNLPSLYFWLLSNACSCNRQKPTKRQDWETCSFDYSNKSNNISVYLKGLFTQKFTHPHVIPNP